MNSPKAALEAAVDLITDCVPDDLIEKPEYLRQLQAAIPVAELEGQAMELLKESKRVNFCNVHLIKNWRRRANIILTQLEALK